MQTVYRLRPHRYRSIFISDLHLGYRGCRADLLLDFLRSTESETLYLVGDVVDVWALKRGVYWPREHNLVLREILRKGLDGTRVIYLPGNHDEAMRDHLGTTLDSFSIVDEHVHVTADGRRLLVLHGDRFDTAVQCSRLVALLGSGCYALLLRANHGLNRLRRRLGFPDWSLAAHVKQRVPKALRYIRRFEDAASWEAKRRGLDGVVCGHIHQAAVRVVRGVLYCNDGDWVENCTSLVETHDGRLELLQWAGEQPTAVIGTTADAA